ncbi:hypothetical protein [Streptomyces sp. NPDC087297]|uniref:hypothetical protein n=1 Tax=Streptomyces sp. NPDC087297 TaxID=3365778 RepID=UPI0038178C0B
MSDATASTDPLLFSEGVAERIGVKHAETVRVYLKRTRKRISDGLPVRPQDFPLPDEMIRRSPAWRTSTIERWVASRPGRGHRPTEP